MRTDTETHYGTLTPALRRELEELLGPQNVLAGEDPRAAAYHRDETAGGCGAECRAEAVVFPNSTADVAAILTLADRERIPVTPRGGGTGLAGGAAPVHGGIVLALERMNRIFDIDLESLCVRVQPGVVVKDLNDALAQHGLTFPCFPISYETCTVGGNVATNAGGGMAVKYGVTGRYVLGVEAVLPSGQMLPLDAALQKNMTGYNLIPLLVGSEGTLGVITTIVLRVIPLPRARMDLLALFPDSAAAIRAVPRLIVSTGVTPASIEFIDRLSLEVGSAFVGLKLEHTGAGLIVAVDGADPKTVEREYERIRTFVASAGALTVLEGRTPAAREELWLPRKNLEKAFKQHSPYQTCEDIVLPPGRLPEMLAELERIAEQYGVLIPTFGHAGDGNLHPRIVAGPDWSRNRWSATLPEILTAIYRAAGQRGGQISGEHGIGAKRRPYISLTAPAAALDCMRGIKALFDPNHILNPGKIFEPSG